MAVVLLFWNINTAAVTSGENAKLASGAKAATATATGPVGYAVAATLYIASYATGVTSGLVDQDNLTTKYRPLVLHRIIYQTTPCFLATYTNSFAPSSSVTALKKEPHFVLKLLNMEAIH